MQRFSAVAAFRLEEAAADFIVKVLELAPQGVFQPGQFLEAHGVGEVCRPAGFVQVESYADDAVAHAVSVQGVLYEDAADLALADPDVVGPFDAGLDAVAKQVIPYAQGSGAGDADNVFYREVSRLEEQAESEVFPGGGMPGVGALSAACGLFHGGDH